MKTQIGERLVGIISTLVDERNGFGFDKYKETLDDVPYENYNWDRMALEEALDGMQYLLKENQRLRDEAGMDFKMYQNMSERTMPKKKQYGYAEKHSEMSKSNYALGLCGEAGELGEIVKKNVHHGHVINRDNFVKEAGDVLHYLAGICTMYEVTLEEVATMNLMKLDKRYGKGFSSEASIERVDVNDKPIMLRVEKVDLDIADFRKQWEEAMVTGKCVETDMKIWTNDGDL
jgi:NTP pyrophosphatase (non-canonical NTP hydrolase)